MKLALFFTCNVSLRLWIDTGLFEREKLLYEEHLRRRYLEKVYWLTYGRNDAEIASQLKAKGRLHPDIIVLPMPRIFPGKFGALIYSLLMPLLNYRSLKTVDILKTNQMFGSWSAVLTKWLHRKPLVVRTGYTWSLVRTYNKSKFWQLLIRTIESFAYKNNTMVVITSERQSIYISNRYSVPKENISVIPNYIDTKLFKPAEYEKNYTNRLVFIGRLSKQKNLFNLIDAISQTKLVLDIYGQGQLGDKLDLCAKRLGARVNFMGVVPNNELPQILNRYRYFVLPSLYEGMPKSLLEAMACGLVCIGTDVEGINEIIENDVDGYLAKSTDATDIAKAIDKAISLSDGSILLKAVEKIHDKFSLAEAVTKENGLFSALTG